MEGMSLNGEFWRGRRVLVTGHTGFKGAWLYLLLDHLGAQVTGIALPPEHPRGVFEAAAVRRIGRSVNVDIRDLRALEEAMVVAEPEIVLHLAAQALVLPSYEAPLTTFSTNVTGTAHLLEVARRLRGLRAVVVVTS